MTEQANRIFGEPNYNQTAEEALAWLLANIHFLYSDEIIELQVQVSAMLTNQGKMATTPTETVPKLMPNRFLVVKENEND
jgi:hypothetical protein